MKLEVIQTVFVHFCIYAVIVIEAFDGLLPLKIQEKELTVLNLIPIPPRRKNLTH